MNRLLKFFSYQHLPVPLQVVSKPCAELAEYMDLLPESPEKTAGLRKLLEAKDCFVRAKLELMEADGEGMKAGSPEAPRDKQ